MGLSSKQVSSDRHGWNQALLQANTLELPKPASMKRQSSQVQEQQQQQQPQQPQQPQPQQQAEHLKCPRCESSNTKFCYYNNYNRSQPRHFCKACKRHWTKGGTLRNVPVGGGRKNKRVKTSNSGPKAASKTITSTTTTTPTGNTNDNIKALLQQQSSRFSLPLGVGAISSLGGFDDKSFTHEFYQTLVRQPPPTATNTTSSAALPETSITFNTTTKGLHNGIFLGATHDHNNSDLQFPYSNLGSFESNNNPCSISSSNFYNLTSDHHHHQPNNGLEETVMNSLSSSSMSDHHHQTWNATTPTTATPTTTTPTTANSVMMDISSNWGWDDFDKFVTVDADLTMPWDDDDDDADIKPSGPL